MIVENYLELTKKWKKEYGLKSVVLMQVGSFFEIYALKDSNGNITGSDIEEISSYCDLLIAKKGQKIKDKQVIMAGFGLTQIDKYIKKIQELNYTCIIYTQDIQAPNTSRSLDKIISPGTYFCNEETDIVSNNISCIWINKQKKTKYYDEHVKIGFSSVDISSGKSIISQYESLYYKDPSTYDDIERQISITAPHESILAFKNFDDKDIPSIINYIGLSDKKYHLVKDDETELSVSVNNSEKQKYQSQVMTLFFPNISPEIISEAFRSHEISMQSYTVLLNFIYKHNPNILKNIDLNIKKKETVSVVGESGSGKTSLIMLVGGLEKPTSGKIIFQNQEITSLNEDEVSEIRKKNIGIVFQSFYLIPNYTAVENVALTLELNNFKNPEKEAKILLDRFGLKHRFNNLPSQLSGGEQQRVAIARAIAMKPELILADEPTGNLDTENSTLISNILFKYVKEEGSSLIMVTHDPKLADKAKRKIKIKDGKIK